MMNDVEKAVLAYEEKFKENFPFFCMRGATDDEIAEVANECVKNGRPFEVEKDSDY